MHRHPTFKADFDTGDMEVQETNSATADNGGGGGQMHQQQHDPSLRVFEEEESVYVDSKRMHRLPPIPASALPPLMPPAPPFPTASSEMVASNRPMNLNYTKPSDGTMFSLNSHSQDAGSASQSQSASQSRSQSASQSRSASQSQSQSASSPYDSVPVYAVVATPVDEMADMSTLGQERRKNKKIMTCLVVSLLLVIGLAVAVGLLVSSSKKKAARAAAGNANAINSSDGGDQVGKTADATDPPTPAPHPLFFGAEEDAPTTIPVASPSFSPTTTRVPTLSPTRRPTHAPNFVWVPTVEPTRSPTREPTRQPSATPTRPPTRKPTPAPVPVTETPTYAPVAGPTTGRPTRSPTRSPTRKPTLNPTRTPTRSPTKNPTKDPSLSPVEAPKTDQPTEGPEEEQVTDEPTPAPVPVVVDTEDPTQSPVTEPPPDTDSPVASPPETDAPVASPPEETAPPDPTPSPTVLIVNRLPPNPTLQLQTSFNGFDEKKSKAGNIFIVEAVAGGVSVNGMAVHVSTPAMDNVAISVWTAYAATVGDITKIKNPNGWTQVVAKKFVRSSGPRNGTPVAFDASSAVKICPGRGVAFYVLAEAAASQGGKKGKTAKPKLLSTPSKLFVTTNHVKNDQLMIHAGIATDGKKASKERVMWNGEMRYAPARCP